MANPWFRWWVGTVSDAKLHEAAFMAEVSRSVAISAWAALLESASETDARGAYSTSARRIAVTLVEPVERIENLFAAFAELGMISAADAGGGPRVTNWEKRQPVSERPADAAERQRRSREARAAALPPTLPPLGAEPDLFAENACHSPSRNVTAESRAVTAPEEEEDSEEDSSSPPGGASADVDFSQARAPAKPFGELTGATVLAFPTRNPFEAEARIFAVGLGLAGDEDFSAVSRLIASGAAAPCDVLAAIEDARGAGASCPKSWAKLEGWVRAAAKRRRRIGRRGERLPARDGAALDREARAHFEAVWNGFPRDRTASRPKAEAAFAELSSEEQAAFAGSIRAIAEHIAKQKLSSPHNLAAFIAERRFQGFAAGAPAAAARVKVFRDSPAGAAWEAHWRRVRGVAPWSLGDGLYWWFETEWPPGAERREASG